MKITYALEVIAGLALGMGLSRVASDSTLHPYPLILEDVPILYWPAWRYSIGFFGPIFLGGVGAAGAVGIVVEALRKQSPQRWGNRALDLVSLRSIRRRFHRENRD